MNNDKIVRWSIYAYFFPLFLGFIGPSSFIHDRLYFVGRTQIDGDLISQQIHSAFDQITSLLFYYPILIWLFGFALQMKYYRAKKNSAINTLVFVIPLLIFILALALGAHESHSIIDKKIRGVNNDDLIDVGHGIIRAWIQTSSIPYLLSTAIMAIFYRRKG